MKKGDKILMRMKEGDSHVEMSAVFVLEDDKNVWVAEVPGKPPGEVFWFAKSEIEVQPWSP